jgi:hypothetical protein
MPIRRRRVRHELNLWSPPFESDDSGEKIDKGEDDDDSHDTANVKSKVGVSGVASKANTKACAGSRVDLDEYEEFLRFMAMINGKGQEI